jgi:hypothetical protein
MSRQARDLRPCLIARPLRDAHGDRRSDGLAGRRATDMSHSDMVAIVTPIVTLPLMAFWLIMVFRADSHPGYRHRPPLPVPDIDFAVTDGAGPEAPPQPRPSGPRVSRKPDAGRGCPPGSRHGSGGGHCSPRCRRYGPFGPGRTNTAGQA